MRFGIALVVAVACGGSPPPQKGKTLRPTIPRRELPVELAPHVPAHGVLVLGGGVKSPAFRIVVNTDAKTISSASGPADTPLAGTMPQERTRELTPRNEQHLMRLCADAWMEDVPPQRHDPVEGYEEYLVIADGEELFFLHERGPIKRPLAVKAIEALRAAGAF
jgi:hypothetical protein